MKNKRHNEYTKKILCASLLELLSDKPLHKISIREITEKAQVNRQTFYYHFDDIYALVKWMFREEAFQLVQQLDQSLQWEDSLMELFTYIENNRKVLTNIITSVGNRELKRLLYDDTFNVVLKIIDNIGAKLPKATEEYKHFLSHFYTLAFAGLLESWLFKEITDSPESIIEMIRTNINDQIQGAILRSQAEEPI